MEANIKQIVNKTNLTKSPLMPIHEAITNSIQSIILSEIENGLISIYIERDKTALSEKHYYKNEIKSIIIEDNGIGFTDENFQSFNVYLSDFKSRRFGSKGVGRFSWLKAFSSVKIESVFIESGIKKERSFDFVENGKGIKNHKKVDTNKKVQTKIILSGLSEVYKSHYMKNNEDIANLLLEHILIFFVIGKNTPQIELSDNINDKKINLKDVFIKNILSTIQEKKIDFKKSKLSVKIFKVPGKPDSHTIYFCANQRPVKETSLSTFITDFKYVPHTDELGNFFNYSIYVEHKDLDSAVRDDRTDFQEEDLFKEQVDSIKTKSIEIIKEILLEILAPLKEERLKKINSYIDENPRYSHLKLDSELLDNVDPSKSKKDLDMELHEISFSIKEKIDTELQSILKKNLNESSNINRFEEIISKIDLIKKSELSDYIAYRKTILEVFSDSLKPDNGKYKNEDVIHNLIFPQRKNNKDIDYLNHNLWILDDRFSFYQEIYSDINSKTTDNTKQRFDLGLFEKIITFGEGDLEYTANSITIIEFKKPERDNYTAEDNPVKQVFDYAYDVMESGEIVINGRKIKVPINAPFHLFVVCDFTKSFHDSFKRNPLNYVQYADGEGYYYFAKNFVINIYSYNKVLKDAKQRNSIFFKTLGIDRQ
jgi:hypothetical protein